MSLEDDLLNDLNDFDDFEDDQPETNGPSKLLPILQPILQEISTITAPEHSFILEVNDMTVMIDEEIASIHEWLKSAYRPKFGELESLLLNPVEYASVVKIIGDSSQLDTSTLENILARDKMLLLSMSAVQFLSKSSLDNLNEILEAAQAIQDLDAAKQSITRFILQQLSSLAPNLTAIVGAPVAANLLSSTGGLLELAKVPACNIPSLGNKGQREGHIYSCDIISSQPIEFRKQAARIVSGKLILAARVDASKSSPDGALGQRWFKEINDKLEKLGEAPANSLIKPLPKPEDAPKKKRAGRKFRKMKQQFEVSELRKAQNRMEFGKRETTMTDAYGEEIGLGMANSSIGVSSSTKAKMSKAMKNRVSK